MTIQKTKSYTTFVTLWISMDTVAFLYAALLFSKGKTTGFRLCTCTYSME